MHAPETHDAPTTWRGFLRAYAMIVLSILTALAFEHMAVGLQHQQAAATSRARILAELRADLDDLKKATAADAADTGALRQAATALFPMVQRGQADPPQAAAIMGEAIQKGMRLETATFQRDAWDAALADQSAGHLAARDLREFSETYATARDSAEAIRLVLNGNLFDQLPAVMLDVKLGHVDPRNGIIVLYHCMPAAQQITAVQQALAQQVETALAEAGNGDW